ncbi:MAG TPA: hypothetical protein VG603_03785 [Chitinophagales bacterium]|nr:hypothetical protein [Chitinophagales bacterium]
MNKISAFFTGRCPRCGQGPVFVSSNPYNLPKMLATNKECAHCHLDFSPEIGFYWGATYVAYALTVAFSGFTFLVSTLVFGFMNSLSVTYVLVNGILLFLLSPVFFRYSRMLWLLIAR